jgi:hypothetical protein
MLTGSTILSWLSFLAFTVLPVAFRELLHWLYDWQILLTGLLAVFAARLWGRSVIRAARITARAKAAVPAEPARRTEPVVVPIPLGAAGSTDTVIRMQRPPEWSDLLFALREQIRIVLGKLPCSDDVLTAERIEECRKIAQFPLGELPDGISTNIAHRFEALRSKLSALGGVRETDSCRNAWEALAQISMDARDLMGQTSAKAVAR